MTIPGHWNNVAKTVRLVVAGDYISVSVEGGYISREAPCDGVLIETRVGEEIFVPKDLLPVGALR